jgi:hypothetical protein
MNPILYKIKIALQDDVRGNDIWYESFVYEKVCKILKLDCEHITKKMSQFLYDKTS